MAGKQVLDLWTMTVPELQFELQNIPHTIIDQYIINDMIKRKTYSQLTCQARKNVVTKFRSYPESCIRGVPSMVVIKDNDNSPTFSIFDYKSSITPCKSDMTKYRGDLTRQTNFRLYEDMSSNKQIQTDGFKPVFEKPYR